ncbi:OmpA family protein [Oxynema aestuarii]|uniref:OmpA family protein n=1 Tax=Oxynema aestuarii AP17 TaxID=2064643 RepID=A0A6H1TSW7_9CYAN|nr:OmpA family protein [Oxynema aestuarii]QIZ69692.1 OmpA family protein [Oxynema aestuarii AP17]
MTHSAPDSPSNSKPLAILKGTAIAVWRLCLLGSLSAGFLLLGMAIAHFYPHPNPHRPLLDTAIRLGRGGTLPASQSPPRDVPSPASSPSPSVSPSESEDGDRLPTSAPADSANPAPAPEPLSVTLPSDVFFAPASSTLNPDKTELLDNIISDLRNYQGATIRIAGHTDNTGDARANQELSAQRARAVAQYLTETLGDRYQWQSVGYGETRPLADNDSDLNRQRNRRIEIEIQPK